MVGSAVGSAAVVGRMELTTDLITEVAWAMSEVAAFMIEEVTGASSVVLASTEVMDSRLSALTDAIEMRDWVDRWIALSATDITAGPVACTPKRSIWYVVTILRAEESQRADRQESDETTYSFSVYCSQGMT